jgi:hypothetical protein
VLCCTTHCTITLRRFYSCTMATLLKLELVRKVAIARGWWYLHFRSMSSSKNIEISTCTPCIFYSLHAGTALTAAPQPHTSNMCQHK